MSSVLYQKNYFCSLLSLNSLSFDLCLLPWRKKSLEDEGHSRGIQGY